MNKTTFNTGIKGKKEFIYCTVKERLLDECKCVVISDISWMRQLMGSSLSDQMLAVSFNGKTVRVMNGISRTYCEDKVQHQRH